jgi:hypothetical protein
MAKLRGEATLSRQGETRRASPKARKAIPAEARVPKPARACDKSDEQAAHAPRAQKPAQTPGELRRPTEANRSTAMPAAPRRKKAEARAAARPRAGRRATQVPAEGSTKRSAIPFVPPKAPAVKDVVTEQRAPRVASPHDATPKRASPPRAPMPADSHATTAKRAAQEQGVAPSNALTPKRVAPALPIPRAVPSAGNQANTQARLMELHWGDSPPPPSSMAQSMVQRWVRRGDALLRHLAEHGVARHEYRADLNQRRFVWISPEGRVSAEAQAQALCSYVTTTGVLTMAWADPLTRSAAVARLDGVPAERDDMDEEDAWQIAMDAADRVHAEYLYRVTTPHAWYFLALGHLTFSPRRASFRPAPPAVPVIRNLADTREAIESRAEPSDVVRARLTSVGRSLLQEAAYAYRGTDWVSRLERTGKCLLQLADRLPRGSYFSVAAGRTVAEWLSRDVIIEISQALVLLEDEWVLFS